MISHSRDRSASFRGSRCVDVLVTNSLLASIPSHKVP